MTRDQEQFRLPKLPFIFSFKINENWQEAYDELRQDECFDGKLADVLEDLQTIIQSVGIIFTDCSAHKLCFLAKAYMIFVHLLDSDEWANYEEVDAKIEYLQKCYKAHQNKDEETLGNLSPFLYKLSLLFKEHEIEQQRESSRFSTDQFSIDILMKNLIDSLNEILVKSETEHEELHNRSIDTMAIEERMNLYLSHNVNHYDVILGKLFFGQEMICERIEQDSDYKELKHTMSKIVGLVNEFYAFPMEMNVFQQVEMNFVIKLTEWHKINMAQAVNLAVDVLDELLQRFDALSQKLLNRFENSDKIKNYIDFWKKMYSGAIFFCTQSASYSKYFSHPIKYKFLEKYNIK